MLPPILKKEIHLKLIKRIFFICLAAVLVITAISVYVEIKLLDRTLLYLAEKESAAFTTPLSIFLEDPAGMDSAALEKEVAAGIERTSFIQIELFSQDKQSVLLVSRENSEAVSAMFAGKGIIVPFSDHPEGVRLLSNKRLYYDITIPVTDSKRDHISGYLKGIYRVSLAETKIIIGRFLLTAAFGVAGVILCCLLIYPGMVLLNNHLIRNSKDLHKAHGFLLRTTGAALAKCDTGDPGHSHRVLIYAIRLAEKQGLARTEIRRLILGAFLHDLGMLQADSKIEQKPGPLDEKEYALVKEQVKPVLKTIKRYRWLRDAVQVIGYHHENYDGSGYPGGVAHEKIPLIARISAIADTFDILTSSRSHRETLPLDEAVRTMERQSGSHFDPVLLAAFLEFAPRLHDVLVGMDNTRLDKELVSALKKYMRT